jgi:MFS family permease
VTAAAYGRILRTPGAAQLLLAATLTWVGFAMTPVAFLLFARTATGSYAGAGLVVGALSAEGALLAPLRGRLVDRRGADRAVLALALPGAVTDIALILSGRAHAPPTVLVVIAFASGATVAPVGTGTRTVWSASVADAGDRHGAYGLMTATGEASFLLGPLVAGLAAAVSTTFAVAVSGAPALVGALVFAATPGALAVGLGLTSLAYGRRPSARSPVDRYARLLLVAAAGLVPLPALPPLWALVPLALVAGACFAPIALTQNAVIDEVAPQNVAGQVFALVGSAYGAGAAGGAALAGTLVDGPGARAAIALSCRAVLAAAATAGVGFGAARERR